MQYVTREQPPLRMQQPGLLDQSFLGRVVAPLAVRPVALVEVVAAMALLLSLSYIANPSDPLWLDSAFPWAGLAAMVVALRYGALLGLAGGLCELGGWWIFYEGIGDGGFPAAFFAGLLAQVLIAGYFRDIWIGRTVRAGHTNQYLNDRLASITNSHYLLRISHDRLEKDLLSKPSTLRHAILQLRTASVQDRPGTGLPNVQELLEFAVLNCQIDDASVFPVTDDAGCSHRAEAFVGERFELEADDPLVRDCLEKRALSHLREIDLGTSSYLACAPIVTASGRILGLFVVRRMPFMALNFDNLQLLLVLLGYYADGVEQRPLVDMVHRDVANCPYDFALELARMARLRRASGIRSTLVALVASRQAGGDSMFAQIMRVHRALDLLWVIDDGTTLAIVSLLPLTDQQGANGYVSRLENVLKSQFSTSFDQARIAVHSVEVSSGGASGQDLRRLLELCHVSG